MVAKSRNNPHSALNPVVPRLMPIKNRIREGPRVFRRTGVSPVLLHLISVALPTSFRKGGNTSAPLAVVVLLKGYPKNVWTPKSSLRMMQLCPSARFSVRFNGCLAASLLRPPRKREGFRRLQAQNRGVTKKLIVNQCRSSSYRGVPCKSSYLLVVVHL